MKLFIVVWLAFVLMVLTSVVLTYPAPKDCSVSIDAAYSLGKERGMRLVLKKLSELERKHQ